MTHVAIDDRLISKARTVTNLRTDQEILEEALRGYIVQMENQFEILQMAGKLHWDGDWSGEDGDTEQNA
ncbi:MAG: type II toxin-antitoxin system VapB family antitoxin [Spirochaetaceae bacterium]|jgi:Arc/MetJ family transcription regulator|nr:type II toxin-antitoxin system VapB family antitoxin [Spirochaetaceae bacterium]